MELTGKAKEQFEEWFEGEYPFIELDSSEEYEDLTYWDNFSDSMKWGVHVDFFDSVGVEIITPKKTALIWSWHIRDCATIKRINSKLIFTSVKEARTAAIEKANEIVNNR